MGRYQHYCCRVPRGGRRPLKILERFSMPDPMNADPDYGAGDFKAENLVAILRAVPLTDGTCSAVASKAREYGSTVLASTLDEWIQEGRENLIAGEIGTAFARFITAFDERKRRPKAKAAG